MKTVPYLRIRKLLEAQPSTLAKRRKKHTKIVESSGDVAPRKYNIYDGPLVISGISGRFPKSANMKEFKENLMASVDMMTENYRWPSTTLPKCFGTVDCLDKFDNAFFNTVPRQTDCTDPQIRLLTEVAFEAILDAGMNPTEVRGTKTGLFCGAVGGEASDYSLYNVNRDLDGYISFATSNFMLPGRVSFSLDLRGPAFLLSGACASSIMAIETAVNSITLGQCDAAIVLGSNVLLNPLPCYDLMVMEGLAPDGHCKTFDDKADGFARSEAAVAIVIQRKEDARRRYATIRNVLTSNDGFKHEGIFFPSGKNQKKLLCEVYKQAGIDPGQMSYIEAHGTGTNIGDVQELPSIYDVFCNTPTREKPLLVGSVKSNMGHTESAAGLVSLAKAIVTIQTGTIPGNLHFNTPRGELSQYMDDKLKVVSENTPFDQGLIGISSYGIAGTNSHVIIEPGPLYKPYAENDIPVLIPFAGRSESKVVESLKEATLNASNPEFAYLLQRAYQSNISGYSYRGYGMLKKGESEPTITVESCDKGGSRPVWVIFPGMGSQWNEMGKDLMKIDAFAESIRSTSATMKNIGLNLDQMLASGNDSIFNDIHHAVMVITAMQIALYDTLKALEISPEGFMGHSTGEFLCAYADDCFTAEETILVTDARGRAFKESHKIQGAMASVGLSWEEVQARLPNDIELACHNAANNVTVSGPAESVNKFVEELKSEGKFAVVVNSCGVAAHSVHVQDAAELLREEIRQIIKGERVRSPRWISTSIVEADWGSEMARCASPEYFDNNLRRPVLFFEGLQHVPAGAVVIEVSPKGFFQALLKESLPKDCVHVAPMTVKAEDKLEHFLKAVGQMYVAGMDMRIDRLYPAVATPVSANISSISPLVQWEHDRSWNTMAVSFPLVSGSTNNVDLQSPIHSELIGHKLEDRIVFPATGYLVQAWRGLADSHGNSWTSTPVQLNNVVLHRATLLSETVTATLKCMVLPYQGKFEFENEGDIVVTGSASLYKGPPPQAPLIPDETSQHLPLNTDDIYKEFRLRGYNYSGLFKGIHKIDNEGRWAEVNWTGNWITFLDTLLQTSILCTTSRHLAVPTEFEKIIIDPNELLKHLKEPEEGQKYPTLKVSILANQHKIVCPGIELKGLNATIIPAKRQRGNLAYERYAFCPYVETSNLDMETHLWELVDLVLQNSSSKNLRVVDVFTKKENSLAGKFQHILTLKPLREGDIRMLTLESEAARMEDSEKNLAALTTKETTDQLVPDGAPDLAFLDDPQLFDSVAKTLKPSGFILLQSSEVVGDSVDGLSLIAQKSLADRTLALYRKTELGSQPIVHVPVDQTNFQWVTQLQDILKQPPESISKIYVISQGNPRNGILGLVNCLRQEDGGDRIRCIFDPEMTLNLNFSEPNAALQSIIKKDLIMNVISENKLGAYLHVPLEAETNGVVKNVEHAYISTSTPGDLTSLRWFESPLSNHKPTSTSKLYNIAYAAMNFRDVLLATTTIPLEPSFSYKGPYMGFEFSGFDEAGNRVMGITHGKGLASSVVTDPRFVWEVPKHWTLEQAATVPVVYATVLYAFHTRGHLRPGQTVLIHAGTGGVGQAAISVALHHGCTVYTTVGTPEKRELVKKLFPEIKDEHIGNSRDTSFEAQFMELTNGRGVDIILNSLADDKLMASVRCLAVNGKFLEIGVYDAYKNTPLGMRPFLKNIEFHGIELYHVMEDTVEGGQDLGSLMLKGIASGAIRPLPTHVFEKDQVEDAFRFMAGGKHTGKLLIKVRDENARPSEKLSIPAVRRCYFPQDKTYVIVGGLGGLGMEVANWMVDRGARHLILTSRSGVSTGYQSLCLRKWAKAGVTVETPTIDLSDKQTAEGFMKEVSNKHNIGGIFNSALVLRDDAFVNQNVEAFEDVCAPKATVTEYLDELTRQYCPDLDYFVVFSSSACGRGNSDQTNYGWANSVMERICEERMADGLHGLAIQWGVLGQVGVVAEKLFKNMDGSEVLLGTLPQNVDSCLEVLDAALQQNNPVASSIVVAEKGKRKGEKGGLLARMQKIFGIKDLDSLSPDKKLTELGMDSLIGVELKQTLERDYDMPVTKEFLLSLTVGDLKAIDAGTFTGQVKEQDTKDEVFPFRLHENVLVQLKDGDKACQRIFFIHGGEGGSSIFEPLASTLPGDAYAFQFGDRSENINVSSLAENYIEELKAIQPEGPYIIAGYSAGCTVAYEMVLQLEDIHKDQVSHLILLDGSLTFERQRNSRDVRKQSIIQMTDSQKLLEGLPDDARKKFEDSLGDDNEQNAEQFLDLANQVGDVEFDREMVLQYLRVTEAYMNYIPGRKFTGHAVVITAKDTDHTGTTLMSGEKTESVEKYCIGQTATYQVSGNHETFLSPDHVEETASILTTILPQSKSS